PETLLLIANRPTRLFLRMECASLHHDLLFVAGLDAAEKIFHQRILVRTEKNAVDLQRALGKKTAGIEAAFARVARISDVGTLRLRNAFHGVAGGHLHADPVIFLERVRKINGELTLLPLERFPTPRLKKLARDQQALACVGPIIGNADRKPKRKRFVD